MIKETLGQVREEIRNEEKQAGRAEGSVQLMAVSKLHTYENVLEAYACGQRLFGENHVQEVEAKFPIQRPEGMVLHLIGHLQSNKVNKIVPLVDGIDSVDSLRLLEKIEKAAAALDKTIEVLFEVNTSGEAQKSGFVSDAALFETLGHVGDMPHIQVKGLMTVGPLGGDADKNRQAFRRLRQLRDVCRQQYPALDFSTLSMGMSGDFPIAIQEGSTMVRIGTAIFGPRNYNL